MTNHEEHIVDALLRDGTSQESRANVALQDNYVKIEEREAKDFLAFVHNFASHVNFFNSQNQLDGHWQDFFEKIADEKSIRALLDSSEGTNDPHLSLFLAFLKLFDLAKGDLNKITARHVQFFYKDVLRMAKKPAEPDKVHLIFELARNTPHLQLEKGTKVRAGKDENGKELYYESTREVVLNKAKIHSLKSVFVNVNNDYRLYAAPVANSEDGLGNELIDPEQGWYPFGRQQESLPTESRTMFDASLGCALASPLLLLKEGERTIHLQFEIDVPAGLLPNLLNKAFNVYLSGEKEWVEIAEIDAVVNSPLSTLEITLVLDEGTPPIMPYNSQVLSGNFNTTWPLLKLELNQDAGINEKLKEVIISAFELTVSVKGVKELIVQNDLSKLDLSKPIQPFGPQPVSGSTFYIGSNEVFRKKLDDLSFTFHWADLPEDPNGFEGHYSGYASAPPTNSSHLANLAILNNGQWIPQSFDAFDNLQLFKTQGTGLLMEPFDTETTSTNKQRIKVNRNPNLPTFQQYEQSVKQGFVKLVLGTQTFGHKEYPELYLNKTIEKSKSVNPESVQLPNPPYTPTLQSLALNYTTSVNVDISEPNGVEQFFHIGPFGQAEADYSGEMSLLPQFHDEGYLYIGLENFFPPQQINMLFQLVSGTGDAEFNLDADDIHWSYLSDNKWQTINQLDVVVDSTQGFQKPGIIALSIGRDATNQNTWLPAGYHWLRVSLARNVSSACKVLEIKPQAVEVAFVLDEKNASVDHFLNPLEEATISKLLVKKAAVKSIEQPYTSFKGRGPEAAETFHTRSGERLRHKNRCVSLWDYERLVLEAFPSIYKVKCLNHTHSADNWAPGHVTLIAVQNLRKKNSVNVLEPRADSVTLDSIKKYVAGFVSPFVNLSVENPVYEQILVHFKVGFYPGYDPGFYGNLLNEEIKKFLSPWAYEEGVDIVFGGRIYKSDILAFIENRGYVDFVNDFKLYHVFSGPARGGIGDMAVGIDFIVRPKSPPGLGEMILEEDFVIGDDVELAFASDPRSILVSAQKHYITVLKTGETVCQGVEYEGIGFMAVDLDFLVS